MGIHRTALLAGAVIALASSLPVSADITDRLVLILDGSGSMWGQVDGEAKISIARRVLSDLITRLPSESEVGLVAYGHRRQGDCRDVETLVPIVPLDRQRLSKAIGEINAKGKTPLTAALREAIAAMRAKPEPATFILVSDGLESCGGDPCAAVRGARNAGIEFRLHVVGFDLGEGDVSQLQCTAEAGGGHFFPAQNARQLDTALRKVVEDPGQ
ncbi:MAG: VWA domain-containing protein [Deltaproteobacteria bacterium]|nr:VWA domain-containing protein [Deltaproteobacteria bacterium]